MKNAISWFEIPAKDFDRAKSFYEEVVGSKFETMTMEDFGQTMAFFPADWENGVGGCICYGPGFEPSEKGSLVYLNGGDDLNVPLARVEKAGGKVILPKTAIGENGFIAQFVDPEGNRVAFHSAN